MTLLALVVAVPRMTAASDHLVTVTEIHAHTETRARERATALDELEDLLGSEAAAGAIARHGLKARDVRSRLELLGDEELQDLRQRAQLLRSDPVAGSPGSTLVTVLATAALAWLILVLVYYLFIAIACAGGCLR